MGVNNDKNMNETQPQDELLEQARALNAATDAKTDVYAEAEAAHDQTSDDTPDDARPFEINVAARIKNLPPYLFAELNAMKYKKRREGADVVDLGMGSPTDPPDPLVIERLGEAIKNPKVHAYGAARGIMNLRRDMAAR